MAPPGYAPMAPGYAPITVPPAVPNSIALWATILTGAYAAISVLGAVTAPAMVEGLKERLADPQNASPFAGQSIGSVLSIPVGISSFVLLALWMSKIRSTRTARGEKIGGPPAVEWWGWFVPLANVVLPFLGMRAITKARMVVSGHAKLPIGGHGIAHWRPGELPAGGREICPLPVLSPTA